MRWRARPPAKRLHLEYDCEQMVVERLTRQARGHARRARASPPPPGRGPTRSASGRPVATPPVAARAGALAPRRPSRPCVAIKSDARSSRWFQPDAGACTPRPQDAVDLRQRLPELEPTEVGTATTASAVYLAAERGSPRRSPPGLRARARAARRASARVLARPRRPARRARRPRASASRRRRRARRRAPHRGETSQRATTSGYAGRARFVAAVAFVAEGEAARALRYPRHR